MMLMFKVMTVLALLGLIWAVWKVLRTKPKVAEKVVENYAPPPPTPPKATPPMAPLRTTFAITFSEDTLTAMEQLRLITGAQDFKDVVYHALLHYDAIIRLKAEGKEIYLKDDTTGELKKITSDQMRAASYITIPKA